MNYSEVYKQMKQLTDQKYPVKQSNPTYLLPVRKPMNNKGK